MKGPSVAEKALVWLEKLSGKAKFFSYSIELVQIYDSKRISRTAAALSYFLTLSIFPTLICVYTIIMSVVPGLDLSIEEFEGVIPESALNILMDYLKYVSLHNNSTMVTAGVIGMVTTSAASFRTINSAMVDIQGESRFKGLFMLVFSFVFSVLFLLSIYFAAIVMVSGNWIMLRLANIMPVFDTFALWQTLKYPVLLVLFAFILYVLYRITAPKGTKESVLPGAVLAAVLLVLVSYLFSVFINMSTQYPLIYGSLASIIICMLWLYTCGLILIMCNALNFVIRSHADEKAIKNKAEYEVRAKKKPGV